MPVVIRGILPGWSLKVELQACDPVTEGVKITGDGAYCRLHLHSAHAHVALALSQLLQSGRQMVEPGEVIRLQARVSAHGSAILRISRPVSGFVEGKL